jgi:AraC-like DNA-binding protein
MSMLVQVGDLPERERFDYWRHAVSNTFVPLRADPPGGAAGGPAPFDGTLHTVRLGSVQATRIAAGAHTVVRTPRLIAQSDAEFFKLGVQLRGYCLLTQDGREAPLTPGDFALYDTTRPYTLAFDDSYRQLVLMLPRSTLRVPPDQVSRVTARRVSGRQGLGALLSPFLLQLAAHLEEFDHTGNLRLADNIVDLLVTLLAEQIDVDAASPESTRRALLLRVMAFVEQHLGDHELGPEEIAAAHFISTRYLHKLFHEENTTVSSWIRERRLEHCRRDLRDPLQSSRPVSAIAARWGFVDAAHFSRVFRSAYGASPREYRISSEPLGGITVSVTELD